MERVDVRKLTVDGRNILRQMVVRPRRLRRHRVRCWG